MNQINRVGNILPTRTRENPNQGRVYDVTGIAPAICCEGVRRWWWKEGLWMPRFKNLAEKRFGKLTAIEVTGKKGGTYLWKCKCDCGNFTIVYGRDLQNGHTQSCGCLKKENHPKTHGDKHTRLYRIWKDMRQR